MDMNATITITRRQVSEWINLVWRCQMNRDFTPLLNEFKDLRNKIDQGQTKAEIDEPYHPVKGDALLELTMTSHRVKMANDDLIRAALAEYRETHGIKIPVKIDEPKNEATK